MSFETRFIPLALEDLSDRVGMLKDDSWRFVQLLAINTDDGIDLVYSFMKDGVLDNYKIKAVQKGTKVPSVTDHFFAAFVFENEVHDLFGVEIEGIALDFKGNFYKVSQKEPMTILTPEKAAAREKAAKIAAAKAAKAAKAEKAGVTEAKAAQAVPAETAQAEAQAETAPIAKEGE